MDENTNSAGSSTERGSDVERLVMRKGLDVAVWIYLSHRHWALKAENGELLAEVIGSWPDDVYEYKGKRYYGVQAAKNAAMSAIRGA